MCSYQIQDELNTNIKTQSSKIKHSFLKRNVSLVSQDSYLQHDPFFIMHFIYYNYNLSELEAGHSIECLTHASPSIAFNMFLHFVTMWPLTNQPQNHTTYKISQGHSLYQVWTLWDHLFFTYHADRKTNTQTDRTTDADECFTPATVISVSN